MTQLQRGAHRTGRLWRVRPWSFGPTCLANSPIASWCQRFVAVLYPHCDTPIAEFVAHNAVEMVRLLHHAHTRTRPDLFTFGAGARTAEQRDLYIPPGEPTVIAPFIVEQKFVKMAEPRVKNTSQEATWTMIRDMCKLDGLKSLQVVPKYATDTKTHHVLAPRLHVMIAGAPVLSTIVADVPAVLETKVCDCQLSAIRRQHALTTCPLQTYSGLVPADLARDCGIRRSLSAAGLLGVRVC